MSKLSRTEVRSVPVDDLERNGIGNTSGESSGPSIVRGLGREDGTYRFTGPRQSRESRSEDEGGSRVGKGLPTQMSPMIAGSTFISGRDFCGSRTACQRELNARRVGGGITLKYSSNSSWTLMSLYCPFLARWRGVRRAYVTTTVHGYV